MWIAQVFTSLYIFFKNITLYSGILTVSLRQTGFTDGNPPATTETVEEFFNRIEREYYDAIQHSDPALPGPSEAPLIPNRPTDYNIHNTDDPTQYTDLNDHIVPNPKQPKENGSNARKRRPPQPPKNPTYLNNSTETDPTSNTGAVAKRTSTKRNTDSYKTDKNNYIATTTTIQVGIHNITNGVMSTADLNDQINPYTKLPFTKDSNPFEQRATYLPKNPNNRRNTTITNPPTHIRIYVQGNSI